MEDEEHSMDLQVCIDGGDEEEEEEEGDLEEEEEGGLEEEELEGVVQTSNDEVTAQKGSDPISVASKSLHKDTGTKEETVINNSKVWESRKNEETIKVMGVKNGTGKKVKEIKESKLFPCNKCGQVSRSSTNLKKHMMTHTGEKPYQCLTCNKAFRQQHHLADHWRIHSGERPFKCDVCDSRFIQKSSLNLHKKRHSGIKSFACTQCGYATYQKMHLIIHMRTHTGEKPYQCEKCGQVFSSATRLKFHRMIHTGERRYKCEKCGVPFREKVTLQAHMAVHINVGPFECEECGQEFSRLASLSLHRKVHVNRDSYLYVYNKEANKYFNSAVKKAADKKKTVKKKPQEAEAAPNSASNRESDPDSSSDVPPINTPEQDSDAVRPEDQQTPVAPTMCPLTLVSGLSPEDKCSPNSKISSCSGNTNLQHKLKENLTSNLEYNFENCTSDVHPDQVREALAKGTVLETHNDDGKGFFIILPPSLKNKDIMVLSDSPQSATTALHIPDSSMPLEDRGSTFEGNISPNILSESVLETHSVPYPSIVEEVQECGMDSVGMEEEVYSEVEEGMVNSCETGPVECVLNADCPEVLEPLGRYSEAVEEQLHPNGMSVHLWEDNSANQFTEVTYIIEDGKNEPIVIHSQEENYVAQLEDRSLTVKTSIKAKGSEHIRKESERSNNLEPGKCVSVKIKINSKKSKIKKVKSQRDYNCEHCGKACKNSSNYIAHLRTHSGERPYFCDICKMGFKQISHLKSHIRIHTGERPYTCSLCNAAFTQSSRLNAHKRNVHPNGRIEVKKKKKKYVPENRIRNFFCRHCNKTFIGECLKIEHMKLHQPLFPYTCKICGMQFKIKSTMMNHILKHSDYKHICEFCGIEVPRMEDLHKHKTTEHCRNLSDSEMLDMYINVKIGEEKDFAVLNPAMKEGQSFTVLNPAMKEDQSFVVLNPAMEDGQSNVMGSQLKSKNHVDSEASLSEMKQEVIHVTDVDGDLKSEIEEIMSVHQEDEVVIHDITHISPEKEKKIIPVRNDSNSAVDLQKEMSNSVQRNYYIIKEGEIKEKKFITYMDTTGKKMWVCKVCDRSFTQSSNLYCHMRMHTGDKPYKCNVCPKAFRQITHLKDHMRRHTGAKPHTCGACGKSFTQRSAVRRHIKVLHGGNAEAKKNPESLMSNEVIDTLSDEYDQVPKVEEENILEGKDAPLQYDEQLCKLLQKKNVLHICKVCQKEFTQHSRLVAHMRRCGKHKTVLKGFHADSKSCWCGESFLSLPLLLKHQKICSSTENEEISVESETRKLPSSHEKCENVWKSRCEKDEIKDSEKIKHTIRRLADGNNLDNHILFTCRECGEVLHGIVSFRTHLQGHGGEVCMVCGEMFRRASALRSHQSMKHGREDRRYKDYCPMGYSSVKEEDPEEEDDDIHGVESDMDYDQSFSLANAEDEKEDMIGDVKLRTQVKLEKEKFYKSEMRHNPKGAKRDAQQTISDKVGINMEGNSEFSNSASENLENIGNNVEGNSEFSNTTSENLETRGYVCNVCDLAFTRSSKLNHHKTMWCRGWHESQGGTTTSSHKPLKENSSSKVNKFDRKPENQEKGLRNKKSADLSNSHSTSATIDEPLVHNSDCDTADTASTMSRRDNMKQTDTVLFCDCCDKHFKDTHSYQEHKLVHSTEKPFKCEQCPLTFKRKAHLFNHYRRHAREKRL